MSAAEDRQREHSARRQNAADREVADAIVNRLFGTPNTPKDTTKPTDIVDQLDLEK